jgi:hypothetical protein
MVSCVKRRWTVAKTKTKPKKPKPKTKKTLMQKMLDGLAKARAEIDAAVAAVSDFREGAKTAVELREVLGSFDGTVDVEALVGQLHGELVDFADDVATLETRIDEDADAFREKTLADEVAALKKKKFG